MNALRPISETPESVTLSRANYEALLVTLEDARDVASARAVEAAAAAGETEYLPIDMVERLAGGNHPLRVWREYWGLTGMALAAVSGVPQSYISEIETRRKPGSFDAMVKLAGALRITLDNLVD